LPVRVFTKICILKHEALQTRRDKIKRTPNPSKVSATPPRQNLQTTKDGTRDALNHTTTRRSADHSFVPTLKNKPRTNNIIKIRQDDTYHLQQARHDDPHDLKQARHEDPHVFNQVRHEQFTVNQQIALG
jgi:hypothetical protein